MAVVLEVAGRWTGSSLAPNDVIRGLARGMSITCLVLSVVAFALRGSLWCTLAGLELRSLKGGRPSRLRCALRTLRNLLN